jgi:hypothetical protein
LQVLEGIDFDYFNIVCIVVENDVGFSGSDEVRRYLTDRGFEFAARIYGDDVFRKVMTTVC